jgi:hypothetical protein
MFTMPRYEVKYKENEDWKEISELELIDGLYKLYHRVSPAIKEMIEGKELHTPDAVYRLRREFGDDRGKKPFSGDCEPILGDKKTVCRFDCEIGKAAPHL